MSNKSQAIIIRDMPHCVRDGLSELEGVEDTDVAVTIQSVISEVGEAKMMRLPAYSKPFQAYTLRKKRAYKLPGHVFGKMHLNDAYSAFIPIRLKTPAVGSKVIINPRVTPYQERLISMYNYIQADVTWIFVVPAPIGTGIMLRAYAPEFDVTTETRGVRWRPMSAPPIAVTIPWSNDLSVIPTNVGRAGQSGLSVVIETQLDNTVTEVATPLEMVAFCCVHNVHCSGLIPDEREINIPGLNFTPLAGVFDTIEWHSSNEVTADATNDGKTNITSELGTTGNLTTEVEEAAKPATKPKSKTSAGKSQTGVLNATWFPWRNVTINSGDVGVWKELSYNPYTDRRKGESPSLPFQRSSWSSGSRRKGYVTTIDIKFAIPRAPQISAIIEIYDSNNSSSRILLQYGETKEMTLIPKNFAIVPPNPVRYANNPWLKVNECTVNFRYRLLAVNRNGDIADTQLTMMVRVGETVFQGPRKPRRTQGLVEFQWLFDQIDETFDCLELHCDSEENRESINNLMLQMDVNTDNINATNYIAPMAGDIGEIGETNETSGLDETLDQDEFAVEVFRGVVPVGEEIAIPLNLSMVVDSFGDGLTNPITQKFERFAHVQPTREGVFGPSIGTYVIKVRLPTDVAGDIHHVLLPQDMNDEAVLYIFGLSSILSMATSALQPVGGALLSGALNAGRNILGNLLGNLIGGVDSSNAPKEQPTATPNIFGGSFDLSRFINFLKPVVENEIKDPTMGTLLVAAKDFISSLTGRALTEIPISVIMRMDAHETERTIYNRAADALDNPINELWIPKDRYSYIAQQFVANPNTFVIGSKQNTMFTKFILTLEDHLYEPSVCLKEIVDHPISEAQIARIMRIKTHNVLDDPPEWEAGADSDFGQDAEKHFALSD